MKLCIILLCFLTIPLYRFTDICVLCAVQVKLQGSYLLITCSYLQQVQVNDQYRYNWLSFQTMGRYFNVSELHKCNHVFVLY